MGRFKTTDDLVLPVIGKAIASFSPKEYIAIIEKSRGK